MKLKDKIALVTGAASGIGRATALLFAREGARVVVNDLDLAAAQKTVDEMGADGSSGLAVRADVSESAQVAAMFEEIDRALGGLDILVNNAGIAEATGDEMTKLNQRAEARINEALSGEGIRTPWDATAEMSDASWDRMIRVHLYGTFYCTRAAIPRITRRGGGSIINMASVAGLMGLEAAPHYSAAKAGMIGFTRAVAREVGSLGIRVNAICPGFIETPMTEPISPMLKMMALGQTPMGRWGDPKEVASNCLFLASEDSSYVTGQWLSPNGGLFTG